MMKGLILVLAAAGALGALAAPQLKTQAEIVADGELKAKVLAGSEGVPAPTPAARHYIQTIGSSSKQVKWYAPRDLWFARAFAGEWKDRKDNVMRLARVKSLVPKLDREDGEKDEIEARLDALEKEFTGTDPELKAWRRAWGDRASAHRFFTAKNGARYYVEFSFAEKVERKEAEKLLKNFEKSVSTLTAGTSSNLSSMKWWTQENAQYSFLTDLNKSKGGKFISDAMRLMTAMRKSYEFYVPPEKEMGVGKVRVFRTLEGYRSYRRSTGDDDQWSCGLWDPSREELLIAAEDQKQAQETMRHEAFHQYLHYATGRGDHAMWFNEGHACFFESVKYNGVNNTVKVVDEGNRATWVARNPALIARSIESVLKKDYAAFYSGDMNLNYCTAWAVCYFLEKGAWASSEFEAYRGIVPKYLAEMARGASAADATEAAWALVRDRDVAADFLKFWKEKRKAARNAR